MIVDWAAVGKVVLYSTVASVGISVAFGLAVRGATRVAEVARDGRAVEVALHALLALAGLAVSVGAAAYGIYVMTQK